MIKLDNVVKEYDSGGYPLKAVNGVSLTIHKGEFVGIVGKSGCGKSTLLNLIGSLDDVSSGSITYNGGCINEYTPAQKAKYRNQEIGFVFQSYHLEPHFSVLMNVSLPMVVAGIGKAERESRAMEALTQMGLADKSRCKPSQLSGGEAQRVAIARAIVSKPKLLLADEPTGNLDTLSGNVVMEYLKAINNSGVTVIMVTQSKPSC